jgi:hypothetical protein
VQDVQLGRKTRRNADRGFILLMVGGLLALIALIGAAGVAIFSWILSLFR